MQFCEGWWGTLEEPSLRKGLTPLNKVFSECIKSDTTGVTTDLKSMYVGDDNLIAFGLDEMCVVRSSQLLPGSLGVRMLWHLSLPIG